MGIRILKKPLAMKIINQTSAGGIVFKKLVTSHQSLATNRLWLICQHSQHKGWVFPKGFVGDVDKNETNETAALREVEEEGGIKAKIINDQPIKTQYSYTWERNFIKKIVYYFLMEYVSGNPNDHDFEMSEAKFVTEDEVKKNLTYPSDKEAFAKILQGL